MQSNNCNNVNRIQVASISNERTIKRIVEWIEADELALHKAYAANNLDAVKDLRSAINYWTNKLNCITHNRVTYNKAA